jgi:hypothetical protein
MRAWHASRSKRRPDVHFDAPLLNALAALFEQKDEARSERR